MPEITKISSKGQVVIPSKIREELRLATGTSVVISKVNDFVLLKRVEISDPAEEFRKLTRWGAKFAKEKGIKNEEDVLRIIHKSRGIKN